MERRRRDLELEISSRARQTEAQRAAEAQGAIADKVRDDGFDTARSYHPAPLLDLPPPSETPQVSGGISLAPGESNYAVYLDCSGLCLR